jgi:dihydrofolate reductase
MEKGIRRGVSGLFISLDGIVESSNQWQVEFDEQTRAALTTTLETSDAVLLGRATYTEWAGHWPCACRKLIRRRPSSTHRGADRACLVKVEHPTSERP